MPWYLVPTHTYDPPTACIYCGDQTGPLGDEHIIPRNMGGRLVIKNASCKTCEKIINSQIETPIANMMGSYRRRSIPARNRDKKRRPLSTTIRIYDEAGQITDHPASADEMPRVLYIPALPPPTLLDPKARDIAPEMWTMAHREDLKRAKEKFGGVAHVAGRYDLDRFYRQLAKIAHSYVVAEAISLEGYELLLPNYILTGQGDARNFIGGELIQPKSEKFLYRISSIKHAVGQIEYLIALFRLFAHTRAPFYQVIVARKPIT